MNKACLTAFVLLLATIFLEILEQFWWRSQRLPPVLLQNLVYVLIGSFFLLGGVFLLVSIRRNFSEGANWFRIITVAVWLLALVMLIRLVAGLKAAATLGSFVREGGRLF